MKILVIGPSWVGDMMMSQSLYRALKQRQPDCEIDVIAPGWCRPLLARMPQVSQALDMPIGHREFALAGRYRLGKSLRQRHYQQAIVLPGSWKSALIPCFAGIFHRTGWRGEMRYGLLNDLRVLDKAAFALMVQRYVALAYDRYQYRCADDLPPLLYPRLAVQGAEIDRALADFSLSRQRGIIGFCPGAEFGPAKRWPDYHYARLAAMLIDAGYQIVLLGSAKDQETGGQILQRLTPSQQTHCHNLAGRTSLDQAVLLLAGCQGVVSNDSGLMHVACALDRPLIALYGPSSPQFTPPLSDKAQVIRLISGYHKIRRGQGEQGYHQSLIDIQPELVLEKLTTQLAQERLAQGRQAPAPAQEAS